MQEKVEVPLLKANETRQIFVIRSIQHSLHFVPFHIGSGNTFLNLVNRWNRSQFIRLKIGYYEFENHGTNNAAYSVNLNWDIINSFN